MLECTRSWRGPALKRRAGEITSLISAGRRSCAWRPATPSPGSRVASSSSGMPWE